MKIKKITAITTRIELKEPFEYYSATLEHLPYALIKIETTEGIIGYGEAAAAWDINGETPESVDSIITFLKPHLQDKPVTSLDDIERIMKQVNNMIAFNTSAKAGLEMALLDALGKKTEKPVWKILDGKPYEQVKSPIVISMTEFSKEQLLKQLEKGVEEIKLKVGKDFEKEEEIIKKIRETSDKIKINVDVNTGWKTAEKSINFINKLEKYNLEWIEQPVKAKNYSDLAIIRKQTNTPIMADESVHDFYDCKLLIENNAVDIMNIKLAKSGGILEAKKMIKLCDEHGIKYILGSMISSSLGTAADLHALTLGKFIGNNLQALNYIKKDIATGLTYKDHVFHLPKRKGLGVKLF